MHITYHITGQAQNRINQLMVKYSPKHTRVIWVASLACLLVPLLVFRNSLSNILLSGLFGSAFITFWILNLGLKYAVHKRFNLHYQPDLDLETRTLLLEENGIEIHSSLLKPAFRSYKQVKMITVEDNIIVVAGKSGWIEMVPREQVTEGNCGLLLDILCQRTGKKIKHFN
ncbi:hypothetical protein [Endozoicomonas sp. SCSIO W0465]|uniref:hypothetical protein n=1 Tax=Endozoicomonas sp. SCSIO W0465 TaxID=2918516 RepID=UPI00207582AC|nr:hypothetical protein [Endozoicomonas sp. SCSIO W0465]USE36708.1 hypothetical protein MJO57_00210 [Endozoicomonas sp. SCSIO W0465]